MKGNWFFGGGNSNKTSAESALAAVIDPAPAPAPDPATASPVNPGETSMEDYDAFIAYLRMPRRPFRKPGLSLGEEYRLWHADRLKQRP